MGVLLGEMLFDVLQLIERVGLNWMGDTVREWSLLALTVSIPILINPFSPITGTLRSYIQLPPWHPFLPNNSLRIWSIVTRISSMDRLRHRSSPNRS